MTVRLYRSTDSSAPVLSGAVGTLIGVLDACLVNGYGSKTAAGWAKAFSGTNKAAYRPPAIPASPTEGNRFYLRVDDTTTATALCRGYETMSDVDTGTNPFPTVAQVAGSGVIAQKSVTTDSVARPWLVVATESFFYFVAQGNVSVALEKDDVNDSVFAYGDIKSFLSGDVYGTVIIGRAASGATADSFTNLSANSGSNFAGQTNTYIARAYTGSAGAVNIAKCAMRPQITRSGVGLFCFPEEVTRAMLVTAVQILEGVSGNSQVCTIRGVLPGCYFLMHYMTPSGAVFPFNTGNIFNPLGGYFAGRSMLAIRLSLDGFLIDLTDSW